MIPLHILCNVTVSDRSQLLHQVMKLSYFPQLKVIHTSKIFHGQLYIPLANWLLMIGTILIASIYNNVSTGIVCACSADLFLDDIPGQCLRCLCHVCHILRYMHGRSDSHLRVAAIALCCVLPMAHHRLHGRHLPLFCAHKSSGRCVVHHHSGGYPCKCLSFMAIW